MCEIMLSFSVLPRFRGKMGRRNCRLYKPYVIIVTKQYNIIYPLKRNVSDNDKPIKIPLEGQGPPTSGRASSIRLIKR
jgi:hypothetical protein